MSNIFEIENRYLELISELEEHGGELTDELSDKLAITESEFKTKVEDYVNVIKVIKNDLSLIKDEQARLKELYEKKEKVINRLQEILIPAIEQFGNIKKSGVKYIDYGTGEISIRKSEAVQVNNDLVDNITSALDHYLHNLKCLNSLDINDKLNLDLIHTVFRKEGIAVTDEDLDNVNLKVEVKIPIKDLKDGSGYNSIKEIVKYSDTYKINGDVSKTDLKPKLKENGSCVPNLAKLVNNKSISIK